MKEAAQQYDVGVIVGRFQVPNLHPGHRELIQHVCDRHDKVIVVLGLSDLRNTLNNPLDFESRRQMLAAEFPDLNIIYALDMKSDEAWSRQLDRLIGGIVTARQSVVLYGSRDSFVSHYTGRFPTLELEAERVFSGTLVRKEVGRRSTKGTEDFRAGAVWASQARFPTAYQTVDIAIFNEDYTRLLLCRKPNVDSYQFVGGFSQPNTNSLEEAARAEVSEETHLEVGPLTYLGSCKIDDWRYRDEVDCIKTALFATKVVFGSPRPDDDIEELRWINLHRADPPDVKLAPEHLPLMEMVWRYLDTRTRQEA